MHRAYGRNVTIFDLVVRGGKVATSTTIRACDVGVNDGRIAALSTDLTGSKVIDARGKLVLPGGIDSHCHVEQVSAMGAVTADDFYTATVSAAFGGTTTIIPFCAQHRGDSLSRVLAQYHQVAQTKAVVDYSFHLIITNPDQATLDLDLPAAISSGIRSFKIFMTYERMRLQDEEILEVMAVARRNDALVMVHAENHGIITWLSGRMLKQGNKLPRYHAICHTRGSEAEAIQRIIALAELIDCPILIVHVSTAEGMSVIRQAQRRGLRVLAETCPQYLFLTAKDIDRLGVRGAMFCCSPPPRDEAAQAACWEGLMDGTANLYSSDHAPYRMDASGKLPKGESTTFKEMANGVPGLELRLPLLFTYGYKAGRISLEDFVALSATHHAKCYGLYPRKGSIEIGADADITVWDPELRVNVTDELVHDNAGYTPYAGRQLTGWPITVVSRGEVIVENGTFHGQRGRGKFIPRDPFRALPPASSKVPEVLQLDTWGTSLSI